MFVLLLNLWKFIYVYDCSIPLNIVFEEGSLPPTAYNVVKDGEYKGEIRVGLTFTPEVTKISVAKSCKRLYHNNLLWDHVDFFLFELTKCFIVN